jgi:superfamily II DNA or RNA helicase
MFRKHQAELHWACEQLAAGRLNTKYVGLSVVPGGGKGSLPRIVAASLIPTHADKIAVVVPRMTLRLQAAREFENSPIAELVAGRRLQIRESVNDIDPTRGTNGFVTTYQAISADAANSVLDEFKRHRYILVLDEPHHVVDDSAFHRKLAPLVERSQFVFLTSGTLERHDKQMISFLPYLRMQPGVVQVDEGDPNYHWIKYTIGQALSEHAIIPTCFEHLDANSTYLDQDGKRQVADYLGADRNALWTALMTEYADELLDRCLENWTATKRTNPRSALLVVCANIIQAKKIQKRLRRNGYASDIATSDDSESALGNIERFKKCQVDILVTVAMAYEGLDVPRITHIAALTYIRSIPWIIQMFARAWRYDPDAGEYGAQRAVVYAPNDAQMCEAINLVSAELNKARVPREGTGPGPTVERTDICPLSSSATDARVTDGWIGEVSVSGDEYRMIDEAIKRAGLDGKITRLDAARLIRESHVRHTSEVNGATASDPWLEKTVREREHILRENIETHIRKYERQNGIPFGTINAKLRRSGWKQRDRMAERELGDLLQFVRNTYPFTAANAYDN